MSGWPWPLFELTCWARADDAPPFEADPLMPGDVWAWMCGAEPLNDDLGLCAHHRGKIVGQSVLAATRPKGGGS